MVCPKCKRTNVTVNESVYSKSKSRSILWNLFMILCTGGFWILWMLIRKKKQKIVHVKMAVCQSCGHSWEL